MARRTRNERNEGYDPSSSKKFWGIILGLTFAAIVAWGVYEVFDEDYQEIPMGEDEIGWVDDTVGETGSDEDYGEYAEVTQREGK